MCSHIPQSSIPISPSPTLPFLLLGYNCLSFCSLVHCLPAFHSLFSTISCPHRMANCNTMAVMNTSHVRLDNAFKNHSFTYPPSSSSHCLFLFLFNITVHPFFPLSPSSVGDFSVCNSHLTHLYINQFINSPVTFYWKLHKMRLEEAYISLSLSRPTKASTSIDLRELLQRSLKYKNKQNSKPKQIKSNRKSRQKIGTKQQALCHPVIKPEQMKCSPNIVVHC